MQIQRQLDTFEKLARMGNSTEFEPAGETPAREVRAQQNAKMLAECISHVQTPKGAKPVLKAMMTTACERNCHYCVFRAGRSQTKRVTITPDEMAGAFDKLERAGQVDGLFLSSGIIKGGVTAQDKIIDTVEIVRQKYGYQGYVHLKIMPGADYDQLYRAMQIADRVSINMEGATQQRLQALAPKKDFYNELLLQLERARQIKHANPRMRASLVTQFVVGAVGDTDVELLSLSDKLLNHLNLARVYYMAFRPMVGTPFENLPRTEAIRQHRLYQASFLLRDYGWDVEDLPFLQDGNLRTDVDPKKAWADAHLRHNPIEIMTANRTELLRLPGIGPKSVDVILKARQQQSLRDLHQLAQLKIRAPQQLAPYVLLNGRQPPHQPSLF